MGLAKAERDASWERGWSGGEQFVCEGCVSDAWLSEELRAASSAEDCDFCGAGRAAPIDVLLEGFARGVGHEYGQADNEGVAYESREGGYHGTTTWDTWDLVGMFDDVLTGEGLLDAVRQAMEDQTWAVRNFAWRRRDEVLGESWARFCEQVKYETRYVLWLAPAGEEDEPWAGEIGPRRVLEEIGSLLLTLDVGLASLAQGTRIWRAQVHDSAIPKTPDRLGTAPRQHAKFANRMSPAGIPMFYGAADVDTAVAEATSKVSFKYVTAAVFATSREVPIVDFTELPSGITMFHPTLGASWRYLRFLEDFADALSAPARSTFEQIDYVPTQIVTEYLLKIFDDGRGVAGLAYRSSLTGEKCYVLNVPNDRCVDAAGDWQSGSLLHLGLVPGSVMTRTAMSGPSSPGGFRGV